MNWKYILGSVLMMPLLPVLYYQGKRIRAGIPSLPEASGNEGSVGEGAKLSLLVIGESTMAGVGVATHEEGFAGNFARELSEELQLGINWRVHARSGYTVREVSENIVPHIKDNSPDLIVVGIGANDAFRLNSPRRWVKDVRRLIAVLEDRFGHSPVVFANMPPVKEFPAFTPLVRFAIGNLVELLGKELCELTARYPHVFYNREILRLADWAHRVNTTDVSDAFFSDGVHPSRLTYELWAGELAQFILKNNEIRKRMLDGA
ncbi:MAG: SGNH/GDSL hydrolase family protein [Saprospiraceae bacterium]|nr:SGNH/GDSL hydrolase family protein [Saprospiraceae bacterium]